ncbi:MAG: NAD(P)/FAD-dependent oxidoreductase, partial [Pirellulales bacterium]|nr:NAD(P)/FAD-dependent oxidoreductase [Pirellulales bacterium]
TVAVVGNGASAIQFIPELAAQTRKIYLIQRSPCWVHPLHNYRYPGWARWALRYVPVCLSLHRLWIYLMCEWRILAFRQGSDLNRAYGRWLRRQMRRQIPQEQWPRLIPEYAPGCKRILLSSDYLQTLQRDDVEVVFDPLLRLEKNALVTEAATYPVDAVIFATGFQATEFLQPIEIRGRRGQTIQQAWDGRPKAFFGMATPGFPNLFMLYGPNTNLGHNSIIFMVERQINYILKCLHRLRKTGMQSMEVTQQAMDQYDAEVQSRLQTLVWAGDCTSWYKSADGTIPNNWWGSAAGYWLRTRKPKFSDFHFSPP